MYMDRNGLEEFGPNTGEWDRLGCNVVSTDELS